MSSNRRKIAFVAFTLVVASLEWAMDVDYWRALQSASSSISFDAVVSDPTRGVKKALREGSNNIYPPVSFDEKDVDGEVVEQSKETPGFLRYTAGSENKMASASVTDTSNGGSSTEELERRFEETEFANMETQETAINIQEGASGDASSEADSTDKAAEITTIKTEETLRAPHTTSSIRTNKNADLPPYVEGSVQLEHANVTYRLDRSTLEFLNSDDQVSRDFSRVIAGVLSYKTENREAVRNTWAHNRSHHVWYVVGGDWSSIEQEFLDKKDLLWVDVPESYRGITVKVQILFGAVDQELAHYEYVLKTDDDSYVRMNQLLASTQIGGKHEKSEYWGACNYRNIIIREEGHKWELPNDFLPGRDYYPPYAYGAGYILKRPLIHCIVPKMRDAKTMPVEDAYIGAIVEQCNGTCTDDHDKFFPYHYTSWGRVVNTGAWVVQHELKNPAGLYRVHNYSCCNYGHQDWLSCQNMQCK
jgi:beta-1,3-galactosyltransferase 5/beta-1,3-galactosyltransferase 1